MAAEARGADMPVIVGDSAAAFYTAGQIRSADIDLVTASGDIVAQELEARGFQPVHQGSRRGYRHPGLLLAIDFVSGSLFGGLTDRTRIVLAEMDPDGLKVVAFSPIEDLIADRLGQYESVPGGDQAMLAQARLLAKLADSLDHAQLAKRVAEECSDPNLLRLVAAAVVPSKDLTNVIAAPLIRHCFGSRDELP